MKSVKYFNENIFFFIKRLSIFGMFTQYLLFMQRILFVTFHLYLVHFTLFIIFLILIVKYIVKETDFIEQLGKYKMVFIHNNAAVMRMIIDKLYQKQLEISSCFLFLFFFLLNFFLLSFLLVNLTFYQYFIFSLIFMLFFYLLK